MIRICLATILLAVASSPAAAAARQSGEPCECEAQRPATLAVVDGVEVPTSRVEADVEPYVAPIKERMRLAREQGLQTLILNRLIEVEAARRGVSLAKFYQDEIVAKTEDPTEAEVRAFYERNRAGMEGKPFEEVRGQLVQFIRSQRQQGQMTIVTTDLRLAAEIQVHEYSPAAPASEADRAKVLATVNGTKVTSGELEESLRSLLYELRRQVYEVERDALENRIDDVLVEQEARRRGTTAEALVAAEIAPRARKVDAFDASKFYNENKEQFGGRSFAEVREQLLEFLKLRELAAAKRAFAENLRKTASIKVNLVEPAPPTFALENGGRPALGGDAAPVTVVVFSDFECGKCARTHAVLDEIVREYSGKVRLVARNYPLEQHAHAYKAALAAEAALEQGKYWEYARLLFANQQSLSVEKLKALATEAGLDRERFDAAFDSAKFAEAVDRDLLEGSKVGILGTPAVFVNGRAVADDTREGLKAAIDEALRARS